MDTMLYQFAISHYCEKARWSLDYKKVPYQIKNLLPGLHVLNLRGKVDDTSLPVLRMHGKYIQGSNHIIDALDQKVSTNPLTPTNPEQRTETEHWETFSATELATPFSMIYYSHMLENPTLLRQRYSLNAPWYTPLFFAFTFKTICRRIRELYNINQHTIKQAHDKIEAGLETLERHLQARTYLVGDHFTRADLSTAALLSPIARPEQLVTISTPLPVAITEFRDQLARSPVMQWVRQVYQAHRH